MVQIYFKGIDLQYKIVNISGPLAKAYDTSQLLWWPKAPRSHISKVF